MVSRRRKPDCIVPVQPFVPRHEVENLLLEVVEHADLHCKKEVWLSEVIHHTGNMSKHIESSGTMARRKFGIGCLGVGIDARCIQVVIPRGCCLSGVT